MLNSLHLTIQFQVTYENVRLLVRAISVLQNPHEIPFAAYKLYVSK